MAFPTTGVLDDFNRTDENPLSDGGDWSQMVWNGDDLKIVSNEVTDDGAQGGNYRSDQTYGADSEVFTTLATVGTDFGAVLLRLADAGGSTPDGYEFNFIISGTDRVAVQRIDNGSETLLGSVVNLTVVTGEKVGFEAIGSTLKGYRFTGGAWQEEISRSDSTYTAAGNIGMFLNTGGWDVDDFGGGTVVAAAGGFTPRSYPRGVGRGVMRGAA